MIRLPSPVNFCPVAFPVFVQSPAVTAINANSPVAEVVAEYSPWLSAETNFTVAIATGFPPASRRAPFQESAGEQCRKGTCTNTRTNTNAQARARRRGSIANHYTRVDFVYDSSARLIVGFVMAPDGLQS